MRRQNRSAFPTPQCFWNSYRCVDTAPGSHSPQGRSSCFNLMGGVTFFFKAEDMMNPESWSPEDFVTPPRMSCLESLLVPFVGVGAAQLIPRPPWLLLCSWKPQCEGRGQEPCQVAGPFSTFLLTVYTCSGEQGTKSTVVHVTNFVLLSW